jgi:hypothetical protein
MTDARLAQAVVEVNAIEREVRAHLAGISRTSAEGRAAEVALRQAVALRKPLERWWGERALRAQLAQG